MLANDDNKVLPPRTRFAPSPTGNLHIGGARTALFNWLFSRGHEGGKFILRIDDTDAERSRVEFEEEIIRDMRWLGLDWGEGPFRQSERTALYREWVQKLLDAGAAYPCSCSEERLEELKKRQLAAGLPPRYDGKCRTSPPNPLPINGDGEQLPVRFVMPDEITVRDALRGDFTLRDAGDFIIARSDGTPVYLFTSVIDDHLMRITHVIRGDEHLPNAARQAAIFDALGLAAPVFAHIPMILGADRHKLSKRTGSLPLSEYRKRGIYPSAMCAYLATLSHPVGTDFTPSMDELAHGFALEKISASAPVHDEEHLMFWQKRVMETQNLQLLRGELLAYEPRIVPVATRREGAFNALLEDIRKEHATVPQIAAALEFLCGIPKELPPSAPPTPLVEKPSDSHELKFGSLLASKREALCDELSGLLIWNADGINECLRGFMKSNGIKPKEFFHPLRLALTGQDKGAPLPLVMAALGKEESLGRIKN